MKALTILFLLLVPLFFVACHPYGYDYDHSRYYGSSYYGHRDYSPQQAAQIGYRDGYDHGISDRQSRNSYDYDHDRRYRDGISSDSYVNRYYRDAYARGYSEGYYGNHYYGYRRY